MRASGRMIAAARTLLAGVACAALAVPWPTAAQASPPPSISVTGRADPGAFTVTLRGAASLAGAPHSGGGVIIVPVAGALAQPPGRVVFSHPLPGVNDIVVAQHDPAVVWMVAHLAVAAVPFNVSGTNNEVRVTFGRPPAGAAPPPAAHPHPAAGPPPTAHPQPSTRPAPASPAPGAPLTVSVNWSNTRLSDALTELGAATNTVILADLGVDGRITLRMDDARLEDVLEAIANQLHVQVVKRGETYWLTRNP